MALLVALVIVLVALLGVACYITSIDPNQTDPTGPSQTDTAPPTDPPTDPPTEPPTDPPTEPPTEPPIVKESTATILSTGDLLMHLPVVNSAVITDGVYDFAGAFQYIKDYVVSADYAVANLETTLAGLDNGYKYSGYPQFNCPDGIVTSAGSAGFDMLLTANNHTYDTFSTGFFRTQQVIREAGLDHLGTIESTDDTLWQVHDINGIKVGMVCYTYETNADPNKVALNGIGMNNETKELISTYYQDGYLRYNEEELAPFYENVTNNIADMKAAGAEAIVFYIHWGVEYETTERSYQNKMAQKLCDLGVDVIVGGHPHVVQPMELLTSTEDTNHKTVCLYSMGNALSNQNRDAMETQKSGHTEDGVLFSITFAKYSDGTVILESADILPTWVNRHWSGSKGSFLYPILPLDTQIEDWQTQFSLSDNGLARAKASYDRTMAIVGEGLAEIQTYLADLVTETEAALGVVNTENGGN